ncbi:MAG: hypothetical protein ACFFG0_08275 [Candidatus Thorarchaeota archaeon]
MFLKLKFKWQYDLATWYLTTKNVHGDCIDVAIIYKENKKVIWMTIKNGKGETKTIKEAKQTVINYLRKKKILL